MSTKYTYLRVLNSIYYSLLAKLKSELSIIEKEVGRNTTYITLDLNISHFFFMKKYVNQSHINSLICELKD